MLFSWFILCWLSAYFSWVALFGFRRVVKRLGKSGQNLKINFCSISIHCAAYLLQVCASLNSIGPFFNDPVVTLVSLNAFDFCI